MVRKYSVYDRRTDMPIIINGTAEQCAARMGLKLNSFYRALMRQRGASSAVKYEVVIDEDQDSLIEEENFVSTDALRKKWSNFQRHPHAPEWDEYDAFLRWCRESGYAPFNILRRRDLSLPYSPENCYWDTPRGLPAIADDDELEVIRRWNRTVNVLRKHFGLPLFKEE